MIKVLRSAETAETLRAHILAQLARELHIPLSSMAEHEQIDVTIDGADEVELGTLNLIKGRGGAATPPLRHRTSPRRSSITRR